MILSPSILQARPKFKGERKPPSAKNSEQGTRKNQRFKGREIRKS